MTRKEAIEKLKNFADHCYPNEEFLMSIKALEQYPILDQIKAEVKKIFNDRPSCYNHPQRTNFYVAVLQIIDKYKENEESEE